MNNLENLSISDYAMHLKNVSDLLQLCPKLFELSIRAKMCEKISEDLKNGLRTGFQRLAHLSIETFITNDSLPVFQEMLT